MSLIFQTSYPDIELLGVTSVFGIDTIDNTTRNALYLVKKLPDASVFVAKGEASVAYSGANSHISRPRPRSSALGCAPLPERTYRQLGERPAYQQFIIDTIRQYLGEVSLIVVG